MRDAAEAWNEILAALADRSIPAAAVLAPATVLDVGCGDLLLLFPEEASFHCNLAEEPKNASLLAEAIYEVAGSWPQLYFWMREEVEA